MFLLTVSASAIISKDKTGVLVETEYVQHNVNTAGIENITIFGTFCFLQYKHRTNVAIVKNNMLILFINDGGKSTRISGSKNPIYK
jgi:hypothetical protein